MLIPVWILAMLAILLIAVAAIAAIAITAWWRAERVIEQLTEDRWP